MAAYEALGRGRHPQLPESPLELLRIAETIGADAELSRLFRSKSVELTARRIDLPTIFLNTHPIEMARPGLLESLEELREIAPQLDLALEIHESVLTRPAAIAELRAMLLERNIALAYDDFGAGQARLLELAEAPPHYLKFDRRFVSGLDQAPAAKRKLLHSLLGLARELLVETVAEGIETAGEARACAELGFTHAQGFHIGRPRPIEQIWTSFWGVLRRTPQTPRSLRGSESRSARSPWPVADGHDPVIPTSAFRVGRRGIRRRRRGDCGFPSLVGSPSCSGLRLRPVQPEVPRNDNQPISRLSERTSAFFSSRRSTTMSSMPCSSRNSERWKPSGSFCRMVCSITRGPAKPMSAPGSAMLRSPSMA